MNYYLLVSMAFSLVSINTGGCSNPTRNSSFHEFIKQSCFNPDIVFLQEVNDMPTSSTVWKHWQRQINSTQGKTRGSGVATLVKNNISVLSHAVLYQSYALYTEIELDSNVYHLYNLLVSQGDVEAGKMLEALERHCEQHDRGEILIGGDFNCTHYPSLDRLAITHEKRHKKATTLSNLVNKNTLCDIWRERNPEQRKYTWLRTNNIAAGTMSKARLDRIYLPSHLAPTVSKCNIIPCSLSDHSAVSVACKSSSHRPKGSVYWHFNNTLLQDENYKHIISLFWTNWQTKLPSYPDICTWWDMGKAHFKNITQTYGKKCANEKRALIQKLQNDIDDLQSSPDLSPDMKQFLLDQRNALNNIYKQEAQGAMVRSRFQLESEGDSCSTLFFNLEKQNSSAKTHHGMRSSNGIVTEDPSEIRQHVHSFYKDLYSHVPTSQTAQNYLLKNIPTLDPADSETCDLPISIEELDQAVKQLNKNKTPGLDGLTSEFYLCFWPMLKNDLFQVLQKSIQHQSLPTSCRRAVITLLPKQGDLQEISNWRPVSLLNTDYKILAKALANRLKNVIGDVVHLDQCYAVPERSIYDNINVIRDSIMYANHSDLPLALCYLDQKKAFDSIDHDYLLKTLQTMGFGEHFVSLIRLLYTDVQSTVKVQSTLTAPLPFERGIRQGCPLSGLLYSIAIEPLLHTIRRNLQNYGMSLPGSDRILTVSAYADDVTVFVSSNKGFQVLNDIYTIYSRASSACLNLNKCKGLWVGAWIDRQDQPLNFLWNNSDVRFLGVHLGNTETSRQKNWKLCKEKLNNALSRWSGLARTMSFKGKIIIANQIAASKLLHFLAVLPLPEQVLDELQETLINFVWSQKRHMLNRKVLFQSPLKGGLGLVCLKSRVMTYRFSVLQRLFCKNKHPAFYFLIHYCHMYRNLGHDFQLFYTNLEVKYLTSLPVFQAEILKAWITSKATTSVPPASVNYVVNMPINSLILCSHGNKELLSGRLLSCGVTLISQLLDKNGKWISAEDVQKQHRMGLRPLSSRTLATELSHIRQTLRDLFPKLFDKRGATTTPDEGTESFLHLNFPTPDIKINDIKSESNFPSKHLYTVFNNELNTLPDNPRTPWHRDILQMNTTIPWKNVYKSPISKKEGDVQYRLLHKILPSQEVLHYIDRSLPKTCGWCGPSEKGTLLHLFFHCPSIQPALNLLHRCITQLLPTMTLTFETYWCLIHHSRGRPRENVDLANYLIVSFKASVYWLYVHSNFKDCLHTWKYRIKSKIIIEYRYYQLQNNVPLFLKKWGLCNMFKITDNAIEWTL